MPESNLFLLGDLDDDRRTSDIAQSDPVALRVVADRIVSFMARPHEDVGRARGRSVPSCLRRWNGSRSGTPANASVAA
jgi:hypothetical protein